MKNYKIFKNPYILIEDAKGKHQPFYKEYEKIPRLNLNSPQLCCPFQENKRYKPGGKKKTVKSGFCEVCYVKYNDYNIHVLTYEHKEFAKDNSNYRKIDLFIATTMYEDTDSYTEDILKSPLSKICGSSIEQYENSNKDNIYSRVLHISRVSTGNSENYNENVNFKEWLNSICNSE